MDIEIIKVGDMERINGQLFNSRGFPLCGAKNHNCSFCGHDFSAQETNLSDCPECGEPRWCRRIVKEPGMRCRNHAGNVLRGINHPNYVDGSRSKYMPRKLLQKVQEAAEDDQLMHLRRDIELLEGLLMTLFEKMDTGESESTWLMARQTLKKLKGARNRGDTDAMGEHLVTLEDIIQHGASEVDIAREIRTILNQRMKFIESERKRLVQMQQMITSEQMLAILSNISDSIRRHVENDEARRAISGDIQQYLGKIK